MYKERHLLFAEKKNKKDFVLFATFLTKEIPEPSKAKEHCKQLLKDKVKKVPKISETIKNPKTSDINLF